MLKKSRANSGQIILTLVLFTVALLYVFYIRGLSIIEVEQRITENSRMRLMTENAYHNVLENAIWLLESDARATTHAKKIQADFPDIDSLEDRWNNGPDNPYYEDHSGIYIRWRIVDVHSRYNINLLRGGNGNINEDKRDTFEQFLENLKIEDADKLTASLADWLDPAVPNPTASEAEQIASDPSDTNLYENGAKNGPLLSIEELKMIPGFTDDILDGNEEDARLSLRDALTVVNIPNLNANTAPAHVMTALDKNLTRGMARRIENGRSARPYETMEDVLRAAGNPEDVNISGLFTLQSAYFFVEMEAEYMKYKQTRRVLLQRSDETVNIVKIENGVKFHWDEDLLKKMDDAYEKLVDERKDLEDLGN